MILKSIFAASLIALLPVVAQADYRLLPGKANGPTSQLLASRGIVDCTAHDTAYEASGLPLGNSIETIRAIDTFVKRNIRYREDRRGSEAWQNFSAQLLGGSQATGDCDDYALTTIALAVCAGVPAANLEYAVAQTDAGPLSIKKLDHALAIYTAPNGEKYTMGDTRNRVRKLSRRAGVILKVRASEIARGNQMSWISTIPVGNAPLVTTAQP